MSLSTALSPHSIAKTTPATRRQREATKNYQQRRGCKNYEKEEFQALFLLHFGASSLSLSRSNLIKIFLLAFRDEKRINTARERRKQKRVKKIIFEVFFLFASSTRSSLFLGGKQQGKRRRKVRRAKRRLKNLISRISSKVFCAFVQQQSFLILSLDTSSSRAVLVVEMKRRN